MSLFPKNSIPLTKYIIHNMKVILKCCPHVSHLFASKDSTLRNKEDIENIHDTVGPFKLKFFSLSCSFLCCRRYSVRIDETAHVHLCLMFRHRDISPQNISCSSRTSAMLPSVSHPKRPVIFSICITKQWETLLV